MELLRALLLPRKLPNLKVLLIWMLTPEYLPCFLPETYARKRANVTFLKKMFTNMQKAQFSWSYLRIS